MRFILLILLFVSSNAMAQCKEFIIGVKGDTLNCKDFNGLKQGRWVIRYETLRGEPGFEEEGIFKDGKKEGPWRIYSLMGDPIGMEQYKWGNKDGVCVYYNNQGELIREESWLSFNPAKKMDTVVVENVEKPGTYVQKVIKHEGAAVKHGEWRTYEPGSGLLVKKMIYNLGELEEQTNNALSGNQEKKEVAKPKEVLEFEKKNQGKKKVLTRDGRTGG